MFAQNYINMKNKLLVVVAIIFLYGCTTTLKTNTESVDRVNLNLPDAQPISLDDFNYYIIREENKTFVALNMDDFRKLANNMAKLQTLISTQKDIITEYKQYYERSSVTDRSGSPEARIEANKDGN